MDENLAHCSYEVGILKDPDTTPPSNMWKLTADPILTAPNGPEDVGDLLREGRASQVQLEVREDSH